MMADIKFFGSTQHQVNARNSRNFFWFQLGIAAGYDHKTLGSFSLYTANNLATLFIRIVGNRACIDHIYISQFIKLFFYETFILQHPGEGGGLGKIKFTSQSMKCYCSFFGHRASKDKGLFNREAS